jgi:hypothetical protein
VRVNGDVGGATPSRLRTALAATIMSERALASN